MYIFTASIFADANESISYDTRTQKNSSEFLILYVIK